MTSEEKNGFQREDLLASHGSNHNSLSHIDETSTDSLFISEMQKKLDRLSSLTQSTSPFTDEATRTDGGFDSTLNRKISLSESDLLASLHRTVNKQFFDNVSEHDPTDDLLFLEWDRERSLFQDYVNSLRKEIRVLLQERLESQTTTSKDDGDATKIDLLHKSLEEKNSVIEQFQSEYDLLKEKNGHLTRQISLLDTDGQSHLIHIDELKQKLSDFSVDLQNHILIKRRLELSITNLENDCKLIDAERVRLTQETNDRQHQKQDFDKLLQTANVQIAEQGSTIEMLRSENIQVRSQLSTIQRRMFQEKQQIMDYLRQIENDLVEKEQIKQREALLRDERDQLQLINQQDRVKIEHLVETLRTTNEKNSQLERELDTHKSLTQQLSSRLETSTGNMTDVAEQLRVDLERMTVQCAQLNEANRLWQLYQENQSMILRDRLHLSPTDDLSFEEIVQSIAERLDQNPLEGVERDYRVELTQLREELATRTAQCNQLSEVNQAWSQFQQAQLELMRNKLEEKLPIDPSLSLDQVAQRIVDHLTEQDQLLKHANTVHQKPEKESAADEDQLKSDYALLQSQYIQLESANRAWQQFFDDQQILLKKKFDNYFDLEESSSFEQILERIVDQLEHTKHSNGTDPPELSSVNGGWTQVPLVNSHQSDIERLEQQLKEQRYSIDVLTAELQTVRGENQELKQQSDEMREKDAHLAEENRELNDRLNELAQELSSLHTQQISADSSPDYNLQTIHHTPTEEVTIQMFHPLQSSNTTKDDREELQTKLNALTEQYAQLDEANRAWQEFHQHQLGLFRQAMKDWIPLDEMSTLGQMAQQIVAQLSLDSSVSYQSLGKQLSTYQQNESMLAENLEQLNQRLIDVHKQCEEFREHNAQLILSKEQVEKQLTEVQESETKQSSDQQIQTEFFYQLSSMSDEDESSLHSDEVHDYIVELADLSSLDLINRLEKECRQILSKRKIPLSSLPKADLIEVALIALHSLSQQHLEDEAKHLDNETVIRALKEEYELISSDKNELLEQLNSLERIEATYRSSSTTEGNDWDDQIVSVDVPSEETNLSSNLVNNESQTNDSTQDPLTKENNELERVLHISNEKIQRAMIERPELFDDASEETLDHLIAALDKQANQIDRLKAELHAAASTLSANEIEQLKDERDQAREELKAWQEKAAAQDASSTQKLVQMNTKLKRALQTIKEKIQQVAIERPEWFSDASEDTLERLNHLLTAVDQQASQLAQLQSQCNDAQEQIDQLQLTVVRKDDERALLREHLNDVELQLREALDQQTSNTAEFEAFKKEKDSLVSQYQSELKQSQTEVEELKAQMDDDTAEENLRSLQERSEEQYQEIQDLKEKTSSLVVQLQAQNDVHSSEKRALEQQIDKLTSASGQTESQQEKLTQVNSKLKRALQTLKEKIQRVAVDRPDLFANVGEETSERLDHLIATVESQATQIDTLQAERDRVEQQSNTQIRDLQGSLEAVQYQLENERPVKSETLVCAAPPQSSIVDDLRVEIDQLKESLSEINTERSRLNEVQVQLKQKIEEKQREIDDLKNELVEMKQSALINDAQTQTVQNSIAALEETIEQQRGELKELQEKNEDLVSQLKSTMMISTQREEKQEEYQQQIENLTEELKKLSNASERTEGQQEKLTQVNSKLKRVLQSFKDKIHRVAADRPELFASVGEETSERFDHLIATVENQATQIEIIQAERNRVEEQLREEITAHLKVIEDLRQGVSRQEDERTLLRERLNEVEIELRKALDDHEAVTATSRSVTEECRRLVEEHALQSAERTNQLEQLKEQQSQQLRDLAEEKRALVAQLEAQTELHLNQTQELNQNLVDSQLHIDRLVQQIEGITNAARQTESQQEKLTQVNSKMKRVLQSFKDKIHRVAVDRPEMFASAGEETVERLDHLIVTVESQAIQIDSIRAERDRVEQQSKTQIRDLQSSLEALQYQLENERPLKTEALVCSAPPESSIVDDLHEEIEQLKESLSGSNAERSSLRSRLDELEIQLKQTVEENQQELHQLKSRMLQMKQVTDINQAQTQTVEDIDALQDTIEQQTDELKDLKEKNDDLASQLKSQMMVNAKREEQQAECQHQIANLTEEVDKLTSASHQTESEQEKLTQANQKTKRVLHSFKEKIQRLAVDRPQLFVDVGEETSERLDHLIATVESQATQIDTLQAERDRVESRLNTHIRDLQSSLEALQYQLQNERPVKSEALVCAAPPQSSIVDDLQAEIDRLKECLSKSSTERSLLLSKLGEVEVELQNTVHQQTSTLMDYDTRISDKDLLIEEQTERADQNQETVGRLEKENSQLQQELAQLKRVSPHKHAHAQTEEDINALHELVEQQTEQLKDMHQKYLTSTSEISSSGELRAELQREKEALQSRLEAAQSQIDEFTGRSERTESQLEKLVQVNSKLKRALQSFKDKVQRAVADRPYLFANVGEETGERLEHLITTVENQITQIDAIEAERSQMEEQLRDEIERLKENLFESNSERSSLRTRLDEMEVDLRNSLDDYASTLIRYETLVGDSQEELDELNSRVREMEKAPVNSHAQTQTVEDITALEDTIEQQSDELNDLQERNEDLLSQIRSHAEMEATRKEQIEKLTDVADRMKNQQEELSKANKQLQDVLQILESKIKRVVEESPELFANVTEETTDRLDHLISLAESQAGPSREETTESRLLGKQQSNPSDDDDPSGWFDASPELVNDEEKVQRTSRDIDVQCELLIDHEEPSLTATNSDSFDQPFQPEALFPSFLDRETQTEVDEVTSSPIETIKEKVGEFLLQHRDLFPRANDEILDDIDEILSVIVKLQDEAKEWQSSLDACRNELNDERSLKMETDMPKPPNDVYTQTLGLSIIEEHQKQIETLRENELAQQEEIERLIEERNRARDLLDQWRDEQEKKSQDEQSNYQSQLRERDEQLNYLYRQLQEQQEKRLGKENESQTSVDEDSEYQSEIDVLVRERSSLLDQIKHLAFQPNRRDVEIQTLHNTDSLIRSPSNSSLASSSDQGISRRVFEEEMLAWSKESEQLKRFVKQIQIENKRLKEIILKFERMIREYIQDNERLKQELRHLSFTNPSSTRENEDSDALLAADREICYLTLKWLTYEVAQRVSNSDEQSVVSTEDPEDESKQRQLKSMRLQNERLKNQLESYTIHFKHVQNEMKIKLQEMAELKDETERLRISEIENRSEVDRLRADSQDDQLRIQQLDRELISLRLERSNTDENAMKSLRELLQLKERELSALKEKLDYAKQAHQLELQEVNKANQFTLNNAKRLENMDLRHEEKRRTLETRLARFCKITRPLIAQTQLFDEHPVLNIADLKKLIADSENDDRVNTSLSPIRDCLSLLEAQMKDLHHNIIENHARRSKRWKYTLGFECLSCESRWEVTHDIRDLQEACLDPNRFLESSLVEPMAGCSCPILIDFAESDVRLCLDDIVQEVISRTAQ